MTSLSLSLRIEDTQDVLCETRASLAGVAETGKLGND